MPLNVADFLDMTKIVDIVNKNDNSKENLVNWQEIIPNSIYDNGKLSNECNKNKDIELLYIENEKKLANLTINENYLNDGIVTNNFTNPSKFLDN